MHPHTVECISNRLIYMKMVLMSGINMLKMILGLVEKWVQILMLNYIYQKKHDELQIFFFFCKLVCSELCRKAVGH